MVKLRILRNSSKCFGCAIRKDGGRNRPLNSVVMLRVVKRSHVVSGLAVTAPRCAEVKYSP